MQGGDVVVGVKGVVLGGGGGEGDADELLGVRGRRVRGEGVVPGNCGDGGVEEEEVGGRRVRGRWLGRRVGVVDVGRRRVHKDESLESISCRSCLDF